MEEKIFTKVFWARLSVSIAATALTAGIVTWAVVFFVVDNSLRGMETGLEVAMEGHGRSVDQLSEQLAGFDLRLSGEVAGLREVLAADFEQIALNQERQGATLDRTNQFWVAQASYDFGQTAALADVFVATSMLAGWEEFTDSLEDPHEFRFFMALQQGRLESLCQQVQSMSAYFVEAGLAAPPSLGGGADQCGRFYQELRDTPQGTPAWFIDR